MVCLPAPSAVPAAFGMTLDLVLDIFLIYRAARIFSKSDEDARRNELIVIASSIALTVWHFV